jgi:exonuclease SbcC
VIKSQVNSGHLEPAFGRGEFESTMLITRVELENIKNYESGGFDLGPGITAISGPNGSGKTTIIEAIAWTLFDYIPYKKEDFLRRGAKKGSVRVSFVSSIDGREYTVYRDTASGYYIYDPVTKLRLIEQKNQVGVWLKQHLGVEPTTDLKSLFTSAIGVPQGAFTVDFADQASRRKTSFDRLLRVDEYQRSSDDLRSVVRYIESRQADLREGIARVEVRVDMLDGLARERDQLQTAAESLEQDLPRAHLERDNARSELDRLDALQRDIERLSSDKKTLAARIADSEARSKEISKSVELARVAAEKLAGAAPGFARYNEACARLKEIEGKVDERDSIRKDLAVNERALALVQAAIQNLGEKLAQVEADKAELEKLRPLAEEQVRLEARRAELQTQLGELAALKERAAAAADELKARREEYKELSKQKLDSEKLKKLADAVPKYEEERKGAETKLREKRAELERLTEREKELGRARETVTRLAGEKAAIENDLQGALALESLVTGIDALDANDRKLMEEMASIRANIEHDRRTLAEIKDGLCPLLSQPCLNMKEGQGLDQYFKSQLGTEEQHLAALEGERRQVMEELTRARAALPAFSQTATLLAQLGRCSEDLESQNGAIARLEKEIVQLSGSQAATQAFQERLDRVEGQLHKALAAKAKYESIAPLRDRLKRLTDEGAIKRKLLEELNERIQSASGLDIELAGVNEGLEGLGDPRGRSRSLKAGIAQERKLADQMRGRKGDEHSLLEKSRELGDRLLSFEGLDDQIATEREGRAASEKDYKLYIENLSIAEMLPARKADLQAVGDSLASDRSRLQEVGDSLEGAIKLYESQDHQAVRIRLEQAMNRASAVAFELDLARKRLASLAVEIGELLEAKQQLASLVEQKDRSEQVLSLSELIRDLLKKAGPYITEAHLQSISIEANQLYRDITGNPMVTLRWDTGYEIILEENGHDRPFASLSGGEQMAAALAVRLALLKELSEIRIAFFDEPTANMDEERRHNLAEQIGRVKDFDQLFVVSHDDTFEGFTDRVITVGAPAADGA